MSDDFYREKYLKYKIKYLELNSQIGNGDPDERPKIWDAGQMGKNVPVNKEGGRGMPRQVAPQAAAIREQKSKVVAATNALTAATNALAVAKRDLNTMLAPDNKVNPTNKTLEEIVEGL